MHTQTRIRTNNKHTHTHTHTHTYTHTHTHTHSRVASFKLGIRFSGSESYNRDAVQLDNAKHAIHANMLS